MLNFWMSKVQMLLLGLIVCLSLSPVSAQESASIRQLTNDMPYQTNPLYLGLNTPMHADAPLAAPKAGERYSIVPELPEGLRLDPQTGIIEGTPRALSPLRNYQIERDEPGGIHRSNLAVGVFRSQPHVLHPTQGFVGNTFSGDRNPAAGDRNVTLRSERVEAEKNTSVPNNVETIFVAPDGKIYTNSDYDEGGNTASVFQQHQFLFALKDLHGWQRLGGQAITADGQYIFAAVEQHGGIKGEGYPLSPNDTYFMVRRYTMEGIPAPFVTRGEPNYRSENGWDGSMLTISKNVQHAEGEVSQQGARITGLAAFRGKLYVSDVLHHAIRVFDTRTMREYPAFSKVIEAKAGGPSLYPWQMAIDVVHQRLWVVERPLGHVAHGMLVSYHIGTQGRLFSGGQTIAGVDDPSAAAVNPSGQYLLVADDGLSAQNLKIYQIDRAGIAHMLRTIGVTGGPFGKHTRQQGTAVPLAFHRPVGVGMDGHGTIYVATNGHGPDRMPLKGPGETQRYQGSMFAAISEFRFPKSIKKLHDVPTEKFKYFDGLFVDNLAVVGHKAFSKYFTFTIDTDRDETDLHLRLSDYNLNAQKYPDDPRLTSERAGIWAQNIHGQTLLYMSTQIPVKGLAIYRLNAGVAVPASYVYLSGEAQSWPDGIPRSGLWVWTNQRADGHIRSSEITQSEQADVHSLAWSWSTDQLGTIWTVPEAPDPMTHHFAIYALPLLGFDVHGVPHYTDVHEVHPDRTLGNELFERIERFYYDAKLDAAWISGYPPNEPLYRRNWGLLGTRLVRFDHWKNPQRRVLRWSRDLPFGLSLKRKFDLNAPATYPAAMAFAGHYIFVAFSAPREVQVIDSITGHFIGQPVVPLERLATANSILDVAYGATATVIQGNKILLLLEEDNRGKNLYYIFHLHDLHE